MDELPPHPDTNNYPPPIISLSKCLIRPYHPPTDTLPTAAAANNPSIAKWMRNAFPFPYTTDDAEWWFRHSATVKPTRDFAICLPDNTIIGSIGLKAREDIQYRTMEVGYWIGEAYWGKGIASEGVGAFVDWAFENFEQVNRIEAEVFDGNEGSSKVLGRAGFELESRKKWAVEKKGVVFDTLLYCRFREEKKAT